MLEQGLGTQILCQIPDPVPFNTEKTTYRTSGGKTKYDVPRKYRDIHIPYRVIDTPNTRGDPMRKRVAARGRLELPSPDLATMFSLSFLCSWRTIRYVFVKTWNLHFDTNVETSSMTQFHLYYFVPTPWSEENISSRNLSNIITWEIR